MRKKGPDDSNAPVIPAQRVSEAPAGTFVDGRRTVLVIAEPGPEARRLADIIDTAELRPLGFVSPEEAQDRLERTASLDLILVQAPADSWSEGMRSLLLRLDQMAQMGDAALVVIADEGTIDMVFAAIEATMAQVLCNPLPADIAAAIPMAMGPAEGPMLVDFHDVGRETEAARLARLSEEVSRLARSLASAGGFGELGSGLNGQVADRAISFAAEPMSAPGLTAPASEAPPVDAAAIRTMLRARRMRDQMFPEGLFADPAWDMLLDLAAARMEGEKVSVSSLCIAAAVPPTTALRWIRNLTEQGIFQRQADYHDGRRVFITLSDSAFAAMNAYFRAAQRLGSLPS